MKGRAAESGVINQERSDQWSAYSPSTFITGFGNKKIRSTGGLFISKVLLPTGPSHIDVCGFVCVSVHCGSMRL